MDHLVAGQEEEEEGEEEEVAEGTDMLTLSMMMEVWSLSGYLGEEDAVVVEEEGSVVLLLTTKLNKMEVIMDATVLHHSIMGMMMEVWSLSGHLEEEEGAGEEVVVEEEVLMVLHVIMKPNKTEETMATVVVLHRIMSTMMEAWSLSGHLVEEEGEGEEVHAVVVEEEVSMVLHNTMKLSMMGETTDTVLLIRAVEVGVVGEVVEGEEAVVDSTDQVDHRFRQLLK